MDPNGREFLGAERLRDQGAVKGVHSRLDEGGDDGLLGWQGRQPLSRGGRSLENLLVQSRVWIQAHGSMLEDGCSPSQLGAANPFQPRGRDQIRCRR